MTNSLKDTKVSKFTQEEIDYIDHSISSKKIVQYLVKKLLKFFPGFTSKKNPLGFSSNFTIHLRKN